MAKARPPRSPIVQRLADLIEANAWRGKFEAAISGVARSGMPSLASIGSLDDYLRWLDGLVEWAPRESGDSQLVHDKLVEFHFFVEQPPLRELQSAIEPGADGAELTQLSQWIVDFAKAWGSFLDTPASAERVESFRTDPLFRWDDYMPPPSGYLTFNQFFARHVKPGRRPVADLDDASVVVSPADANFVGQWKVGADSTIVVRDEKLSLKGMRWSLAQLLEGSPTRAPSRAASPPTAPFAPTTTTASTRRSPARCSSRGSSTARLGSASNSSRKTARTGAA